MIAAVDSRLEPNGDRVLGMTEAAKLVGTKNYRTFRETLQHAHRERGDILTRVQRHYYVSESALRALFPQLFSATRAKVEVRLEDMQSRLDLLEKKLLETRQTLSQARFRIRQLEDQLRV